MEREVEYNPKNDPEVREMKNIFRAVLIVALLMLVGTVVQALFVSADIRTSQTSDINYTFTDNIMLEDSSISFSKENSSNLEYFVNYTDDYRATYSWKYDNNWETPVGWVDESGAGCSAIINPSHLKHNKVLELNDTSGVNDARLTQDIDNQVSGTIEFWLLTTDITDAITMSWQSDAGNCLLIYIFTGNWRHYDGITFQVVPNIPTPEPDVWYHVKFDYECGAGGYLGLGADEYMLTIDGVLSGTYDLRNPSTYLTNVIFYTSAPDSNYKVFINGIGYTWGKDTYTGNSFDISFEVNSPRSMTYDGNNLWVLDAWTDEIYEYTIEGVYTNNHFDVNSESEYPTGITYDGTYFWVTDTDSREVYQYTSEGVYTGFYFDVNPTIYSAYGITEDGNHLWILCRDKDKVFQYTFEGVYTGFSFDVSSETDYGIDITYYKESFILLDDVNDRVYFYNSDGIYTGGTIDISQVLTPMGITGAEGRFWIADEPLMEVFEFYDNMLYYISFNIVPDYEIMGLEVYRDEFAFGYDGILNNIGDEIAINGWYRQDPYGGQVKIDSSNETYDRSYGMFCDSITTRELNKIYSIEQGNYVNVTIGIDYLDMNNANSDYEFRLLGVGSIVLAYFQFIYSGGNILFRWKDSGSTWHTLRTLDPDSNLYREINIHYGDKKGMTVIYRTNDSVYETYQVEKYQNNAKGLVLISLIGKCDDSSGDQYIKFDYVGAYASINWGESYSIYNKESFGDFALYYHRIDESVWNTDYYNLIFLEGTGVFGVGIFYGVDLFNSLIGLNNYNISSNVCNIIYEDKIYNYPDIVFVANETFTVSSLKITGVLLVEGANKYNLKYNSENIDWNENYFYVENNYLKYRLDTDDDNLEYIQASFDVSLQSTINYTLRYGGVKNYINIDVEFRIFYQDTTYSPYPIKVFLGTTNVIIPQGQVIESFQFLITDNDNNMNYTTTGYFVSISLIYTTGIEFTIILSNYLAILTPILLITIITITVWQTTKRKVGTMLIVPSIALMSFSVFIMGLVPLWLLFVLLMSAGILMYSKWEEQFLVFASFATMITGFLSYASIIDFWLFYMTFVLMVGYLIFGVRKTIKG